MTQQVIDIGSAPDDGTGDPLRLSFDKTNENFTELYAKGATEGLWNYNKTSTDTTTAPVSGRFKTNSGDYRGATQIAINAITIQGIDRSSTLRTLLVGDLIQCQDSTNSAAWCRYSLQSLPVDHGTWFQLNVTFQTDGGVASGDNQEVVFVFTASSGSAVAGAPVGAEYITSAADPTLTAERVLTNTPTITWDFSTAGQAKANATGGGNISNSGTPTVGQYAKWVTATTIQGVAPATVLSDIGAAPLASPTFTGDPKAPTPATADNDTSIATTAYVQAQGYLTSAAATAAYQPLDADLTSLAAASATNVIYYRSAANTWGAVTIGANLTFAGGTLSAAASSGISTVAIVNFTASGTYTPTAGMKFCIIECVGGGGGGGGGTGAANWFGSGAGGGSGGYSRKLATAADIGASKVVTIGAAGVGVSNAAGTAGGTTSVGALCLANGGAGGVTFGNTGGAGGAVGTGDLATAGAPGQSGFLNQNFPAVPVSSWTGGGGSGPWGGGAPATTTSTSVLGVNASAYGSGGGGAATNNFGGAIAGGNGSAGIVIITEYI